jgi:hypothetical protein
MQRPGFDSVGTSRRSSPCCATAGLHSRGRQLLEVWDHCRSEEEKPATAVPGGQVGEEPDATSY